MSSRILASSSSSKYDTGSDELLEDAEADIGVKVIMVDRKRQIRYAISPTFDFAFWSSDEPEEAWYACRTRTECIQDWPA